MSNKGLRKIGTTTMNKTSLRTFQMGKPMKRAVA
jgi:hypothetical protein